MLEPKALDKPILVVREENATLGRVEPAGCPEGITESRRSKICGQMCTHEETYLLVIDFSVGNEDGVREVPIHLNGVIGLGLGDLWQRLERIRFALVRENDISLAESLELRVRLAPPPF